MGANRDEVVASALGSVRAEGGEPSTQVKELLAAWSRGEILTENLTEARRLIAAGLSIQHLIRPAHA